MGNGIVTIVTRLKQTSSHRWLCHPGRTRNGVRQVLNQTAFHSIERPPPCMTSTLPLPETPRPVSQRVFGRADRQVRYTLRLAASEAELHAAQTLRFLVFNVELNEGLEQSFATCRDADAYDAVCDHLLVEESETGEIVGTYRLQTGTVAAAKLGYYSAQEFDLTPLEPFRNELLELGRACVHSQHRNLMVLGLLWKGIAKYAGERSLRYLLGCSSAPTLDPAVGAAMYFNLGRLHLADAAWRVRPLEGLACPLEQALAVAPKVPRLLGTYLSLGAKICGQPAIDRQFKTIDFLTMLDLEAVSPDLKQRYLS